MDKLIDFHKGNNINLIDNIKELKNTISEHETSLKTIKENNKKELEDAVGYYRLQNSDMLESLSSTRQENEQLKNLNNNLIAENGKYMEQYTILSVKNDNNESRLKETQALYENVSSELSNYKGSKEKEILDLKLAHNDKLKNFHEQINKLTFSINNLTSENERLKEDIMKKQADVENLNTQITQLQADFLTNINTQRIELQSEIDKIKTYYTDIVTQKDIEISGLVENQKNQILEESEKIKATFADIISQKENDFLKNINKQRTELSGENAILKSYYENIISNKENDIQKISASNEDIKRSLLEKINQQKEEKDAIIEKKDRRISELENLMLGNLRVSSNNPVPN